MNSALLAVVLSLSLTPPHDDVEGNSLVGAGEFRAYCATSELRRVQVGSAPALWPYTQGQRASILVDLAPGVYHCHATAVRGGIESAPSEAIKLKIPGFWRRLYRGIFSYWRQAK